MKSFLELCLYGFIQGRNQISIGLIFWILMLLWLAYGFRNNYAAGRLNYRSFGGHALLWVLLFLLGWQAFGFRLADKTENVPTSLPDIRALLAPNPGLAVNVL